MYTNFSSTEVYTNVSLYTNTDQGTVLYPLGQEEGYKVQYTPYPEGVTKGEARGNS